VLLREETVQARRFLEVFTLYGWAARRAHAVVAAVASGRLARQRRIGGLLLAGWHDAARQLHLERVAAASTVQRLARGHSARRRARVQRKLLNEVEALRDRAIASARRRALADAWNDWATITRQLQRLRSMIKQRRHLAESLAFSAWRCEAFNKRRKREAMVQRARSIWTRNVRARRATQLAAEQAERAARLAMEEAERAAKLAAELAERTARLVAEQAERAARLAAEEAARVARLLAEQTERTARLRAARTLQRWFRRERARHARELEERLRVQLPAARKLQRWWRTRDERAAMARRLRVRQLRGPYVRFFRRTIREQAAARVITRAVRTHARAVRDERLVKAGEIALRHAQRRRFRVESGAAFAPLQRRVRARVAGPIAARRHAAATRIQAAERGRQCRTLTRALFLANLKRRALLFLSPTNQIVSAKGKRSSKAGRKRSESSSPRRPEKEEMDVDDDQPRSRRRVRLPKISRPFSTAIIGPPRVQALYVLPMVPGKRGLRGGAR
jgi:hypothetical protein